MPDMSKLFAKARTLVDESVGTAGTRVTISDYSEDVGEDLTLTATEENVRSEDAIVVSLGGAVTQVTAELELRPTDWLVLFRSSTALPEINQSIAVTASLEPRLIGQRGKVLGFEVDSSGAYTKVYARPKQPGAWATP